MGCGSHVIHPGPAKAAVIIVLVAVIGLVVACLVFMKGKKQVEHLEGLLAAAGTNKP